MPLTLVFIGKVELEPVHQALNHLNYPPVLLTLSEPGCFRQRKGSQFWVGLRENTALLDLPQ